MEQTSYCKSHIDVATDVAALKEHSKSINGSIDHIDANIKNIYDRLNTWQWWLTATLAGVIVQLLLLIVTFVLNRQ